MLANAALKNPAQNPATVNIHDGQLVIPAAFSPHPNVFDVKAQIFHGASGFYAAMFSPLLLPWTFIRLPHSRWLSFIKPIYFPGVDQIFHIPEFLSHLPIPNPSKEWPAFDRLQGYFPPGHNRTTIVCVLAMIPLGAGWPRNTGCPLPAQPTGKDDPHSLCFCIALSSLCSLVVGIAFFLKAPF